jgi:RNA polymerase sigma-70 factor (ECF subfamily)
MVTINIERTLSKKYQEGDLTAFREIYELTGRFIYNVIFKITLDEEDAKDIAQDTYVTAYERRRTFREEAGFTTWLYRIAVNKALNFIKRKKRFSAHQDKIKAELYTAPDETNEVDTTADIELLKELMEHVTPEYRTCVVLRDIEELSYEDIATALRLNPGTVRSRINRGRQELARLYTEHKKEVECYEMR